ncbi:MAG TPA: hypothetical protein VGM90_14155 [Kofleriaceae bacterium]
MTNPNDKNIDILDAVYNDAALVEAESGKSTPEDQRWARDVRSSVQARLAEMRRNLTPATEAPKKAKPIRPSLLAVGRDALLEKLTQLTTTMGGGVQYAHRHLGGLSDDDLRRLIDTLDTNTNDAD